MCKRADTFYIIVIEKSWWCLQQTIYFTPCKCCHFVVSISIRVDVAVVFVVPAIVVVGGGSSGY
jgi:hypothetical protein